MGIEIRREKREGWRKRKRKKEEEQVPKFSVMDV